MKARFKKIRAYMEEKGIDGILVSSPSNVQWLADFPGTDSQILITHSHQYFITDSRYMEAAEAALEGGGWRFITAAQSETLWRLDKLLEKHGTKKLGIEKEYVTIDRMESYEESWFLSYAYVDDLFKQLRSVKSKGELARMRRGARLTQEAFEHLLTLIRPGVSEFDLLAELQYFLTKRGAALSFAPIIAGGEHASVPHAAVTGRKLQPGDLLTMDFGCVVDGMCTDFTRTVAISGVDEDLQMIYNIVKEANLAALAAVRAGMACSELDVAARSVIEQAGYGQFFTHGTGHGVGVDIHERPRISAYSTEVLEDSMVVTVEPGIYLPGRGGVRIEDMIVVTEEGHENFYTATKDLIII